MLVWRAAPFSHFCVVCIMFLIVGEFCGHFWRPVIFALWVQLYEYSVHWNNLLVKILGMGKSGICCPNLWYGNCIWVLTLPSWPWWHAAASATSWTANWAEFFKSCSYMSILNLWYYIQFKHFFYHDSIQFKLPTLHWKLHNGRCQYKQRV